MKQETIICGGEKCDRKATHLLMSVMLRDGRIPDGALSNVVNPESTFPTCPVCLEEHASKMENLGQQLSPETKNRYWVKLTEVSAHHYAIEAGSEEEARDVATERFLGGVPDDDHELDIFIDDEDVELQGDETVASVVDAYS